MLDAAISVISVLPDDEFGYVLHPVDLATNKILAAARPASEVREPSDLLWIDDSIQPLGAVAWAASDKTRLGFPRGCSGRSKREAVYRDKQLAEKN